jgi:thiamine-phosphate pyrophosphorylase
VTTKPLLCLVTNRRRLAAARRFAAHDAGELLLRQIEGAVAGGVDLVQIREHDLAGGELVRLVRDAVAVATGSATRITVNDRVDVAIAAEAAGVHLRESSIPAADVRRIAPHMFIGRSVHTPAGVTSAGPVDYLIAGTVFRSASKSGRVDPIGIPGLTAIVRAAGTIPVLAIGGIAAGTAKRAVAAGASGVAAIDAFIPAAPDDDVRRFVEETAHAMRLGFDEVHDTP